MSTLNRIVLIVAENVRFVFVVTEVISGSIISDICGVLDILFYSLFSSGV